MTAFLPRLLWTKPGVSMASLSLSALVLISAEHGKRRRQLQGVISRLKWSKHSPSHVFGQSFLWRLFSSWVINVMCWPGREQCTPMGGTWQRSGNDPRLILEIFSVAEDDEKLGSTKGWTNYLRTLSPQRKDFASGLSPFLFPVHHLIGSLPLSMSTHLHASCSALHCWGWWNRQAPSVTEKMSYCSVLAWFLLLWWKNVTKSSVGKENFWLILLVTVCHWRKSGYELKQEHGWAWFDCLPAGSCFLAFI